MTPPRSASRSARLTRGAADGRVYLLARVCGDRQAVGHQAGCLVLLHQPDRNDRDGHLDDRGAGHVRMKALPGRWRRKRKCVSVSQNSQECGRNEELIVTRVSGDIWETR